MYTLYGIMHYHYFVAVTRFYGLICISVTDCFKRAHMDFCGPLWIFVGRYESVTHTSDVTMYANTVKVGQHRHYRAILNCN